MIELFFFCFWKVYWFLVLKFIKILILVYKVYIFIKIWFWYFIRMWMEIFLRKNNGVYYVLKFWFIYSIKNLDIIFVKIRIFCYNYRFFVYDGMFIRFMCLFWVLDKNLIWIKCFCFIRCIYYNMFFVYRNMYFSMVYEIC